MADLRRRLAAAAAVALLVAAVSMVVSRDEAPRQTSMLGAKAAGRAELASYSNILGFGRGSKLHSCEGCTDDEVHNEHPAEVTESLADNTRWSRRFLKTGTFYHAEDQGKPAVGVDCYYTHSVSYCDGQSGQALASRAAGGQQHMTRLQKAQAKERALAMDGANDYDMDCFYHHEVSWCEALHAKQKAELKAKEFKQFAVNRDVAYSSDPELAGLAKMVRASEPAQQRREDQLVANRAQDRKEEQESEEASDRRIERSERKERAHREAERQASADRLHREEEREARTRQDARMQEAQDAHDDYKFEHTASPRDDSEALKKLQRQAAREKAVAQQELQEELEAEKREAAAEAKLRAAKSQLHSLARNKVARHDDSKALPALHRLPVEPALQTAEPVEERPEMNVGLAGHTREHDSQRQEQPRVTTSEEGATPAMRKEWREHPEVYPLSVRDQEPYEEPRVKADGRGATPELRRQWREHPGTYPLDVHAQEPTGYTAARKNYWNSVGVRDIDMMQVRKATTTDLADTDMGGAVGDVDVQSQEGQAELAPDVAEAREPAAKGEETSELEREALKDGLTLVPAADQAEEGPSALAQRGLQSDSQWEASQGLVPVSARRVEAHKALDVPRSMLRVRDQRRPVDGYGDLIERARGSSDRWERSHQILPFTTRKQERIPQLHDAEVPVNGAHEAAPASGSSLVEKADAEAEEVGPAGVKALGFGSEKSFEKHLEKEGV